MRDPINGCRTRPACPCGAHADNGAARCQKCIARFRWLRHKAARGFNRR